MLAALLVCFISFASLIGPNDLANDDETPRTKSRILFGALVLACISLCAPFILNLPQNVQNISFTAYFGINPEFIQQIVCQLCLLCVVNRIKRTNYTNENGIHRNCIFIGLLESLSIVTSLFLAPLAFGTTASQLIQYLSQPIINALYQTNLFNFNSISPNSKLFLTLGIIAITYLYRRASMAKVLYSWLRWYLIFVIELLSFVLFYTSALLLGSDNSVLFNLESISTVLYQCLAPTCLIIYNQSLKTIHKNPVISALAFVLFLIFCRYRQVLTTITVSNSELGLR